VNATPPESTACFPSDRVALAGGGAAHYCGLVRETAPVPGVRLALVDIPEFVRRYLPGMVGVQGLAERPVPLSAFAARPGFLSRGEFAGVGRFRSLKKQVEWICGRLAAKTVVASVCHRPGSLAGIELAYRSQGAPYVTHWPDLPVSISHSHDLAGAISARGGKLGFDLERIRPSGIDAIWQVAFSPAERRALAGAEPETIFRHWTLKEAYLKVIGQGFHESLTAVEILGGRLHHHGRPIREIEVFQDALGEDYLYSLIFKRRSRAS
jgi:4'-phosphopantetheinyl transferase